MFTQPAIKPHTFSRVLSLLISRTNALQKIPPYAGQDVQIQWPVTPRHLSSETAARSSPTKGVGIASRSHQGFALQPCHPINARQQALFQHSPVSITSAPPLCCGNPPLHPAQCTGRGQLAARKGTRPTSLLQCPSGSRLARQLLSPQRLHFAGLGFFLWGVGRLQTEPQKFRAKTCQQTLPYFRHPAHTAA